MFALKLKPQDNNQVTGKEVFFGENELIVSKTDAKGIITYANDVFLKIAGYTEEEVIGKPHSYIRHPDMPKCVFKLLWDTIKQGNEIFAYVVNRAKNGDHYWVFAHVTPSYDKSGKIIGYHSNRRVPKREAVKTIEGLYKLLIAEEKKHPTSKAGMESAFNMLVGILKEKGISYDEFILSL
jgi:PAS domain S-box-containing protein